MGGFGSGRSGGKPLANTSLMVDIGWMLRTGRARDGAIISGTLHWNCGGEPFGSISFTANMVDPTNASLELRYSEGNGEAVSQCIRLRHTQPNYGGRRWWMVCPYRGHSVLKLYLPGGGDRFASRKAWRLAYHSQRILAEDRPFHQMQRIQKRLGGAQGCDEGIPKRPKGMWKRTYDQLHQRFEVLDDQCGVVLTGLIMRLHNS